MANGATIYKVEFSISDMDRDYYHTHRLTIAKHPSENDERVMVRTFAFAMHAHERLDFCKGLCVDDEPELWIKNYSGEIDLWIDLGQPSEERIRKACGRAKQVVIYCYNHNSAEVWWQKNQHKLQRYKNLKIIKLAENATEEMAKLIERSMRLQCTIQDGICWISDDHQSVEIDMVVWKRFAEF